MRSSACVMRLAGISFPLRTELAQGNHSVLHPFPVGLSRAAEAPAQKDALPLSVCASVRGVTDGV